jgi:hypothetical protein
VVLGSLGDRVRGRRVHGAGRRGRAGRRVELVQLVERDDRIVEQRGADDGFVDLVDLVDVVEHDGRR